MQSKRHCSQQQRTRTLSDVENLTGVILSFLGKRAPARLCCLNKHWKRHRPLIPVKVDHRTHIEHVRNLVTTHVARISSVLLEPAVLENSTIEILLMATATLRMDHIDSKAFVSNQAAQLGRIRSLDMCNCKEVFNVPWQSWAETMPNLEKFSAIFGEGPVDVDLSGFSELVDVNISCDLRSTKSRSAVRLKLPKTVTRLQHDRATRVENKVLPNLGTLKIHWSPWSKDPRATAISLEWTCFPALHTLELHDRVEDDEGKLVAPKDLKHLQLRCFPTFHKCNLGWFAKLPLRTLAVDGFALSDAVLKNNLNLGFLEELEVELLAANDLRRLLTFHKSLRKLKLTAGGPLDTTSLAQLERLMHLGVCGPVAVEFSALATCQSLTSLELGPGVELEQDSKLLLIRNLTVVDVTNWVCLDKFPNLRTLALSAHCKTYDTIIEFEKQLSTLRLLEWADFRRLSNSFSTRNWRRSEIASLLPSNCAVALRQHH